jgi:hypothetical protein
MGNDDLRMGHAMTKARGGVLEDQESDDEVPERGKISVRLYAGIKASK